MPFNGSGTYTRNDGTFSGSDLYQQREANGDNIDSDLMDAAANDIADALSNTVCKDGQSTMSGNLKMGTNKITGLGDPTADQDAVTKVFLTGANTTFDNATSGISATTVQGAIDENWTDSERVIASGAITASASLEFILSTLDATQSAYNRYRIHLINILPATDDVELRYTLTADGGSTYASSAYYGGVNGEDSGGSAIAYPWNSTAFGVIAGDITVNKSIKNSGACAFAEITLSGMNTGSSVSPRIQSDTGYISTGGYYFPENGGGTNTTAADYDGIKIYFESGNFQASGYYVVTKLASPT